MIYAVSINLGYAFIARFAYSHNRQGLTNLASIAIAPPLAVRCRGEERKKQKRKKRKENKEKKVNKSLDNDWHLIIRDKIREQKFHEILQGDLETNQR